MEVKIRSELGLKVSPNPPNSTDIWQNCWGRAAGRESGTGHGMLRGRQVPAPRVLSASSALLLRAPACSFWPHSLSSAARGKPPAAEQPGAWLLAVALGPAADRAGAQRRAGFGGPLWARGRPSAGEQPALPQPARLGMEQGCCGESLWRRTPAPTSCAYSLG